MRVAVVGSGISGLSCAWLLSKHAPDVKHVTLFEKDARLGGHSYTVDVTLEGITHPVDTGFLVFNDWTYPNLIALFRELGVKDAKSEMGFSVKLLGDDGRGRLEWAGSRVLAQRRNLVKPRFWRMLVELLRFNREARALLANPSRVKGSLGQFLDERKFGREFRDWYLAPMAACVWSTPARKIDAFPLVRFLGFASNHGLLTVNDQPQWRTVDGGSREYVKRLAQGVHDVRTSSAVKHVTRDAHGVRVTTEKGPESFDQVVLASHTDQSLKLLTDADDDEKRVLGAIPYQANTAVLHTDVRQLPDRKGAWSAWNYMAWHPDSSRGASSLEGPVSLSYLINRIQPLPFKSQVIVTLNPLTPVEPSKVIQTIHYEHPAFLDGADQAQRDVRALQGKRRTWFAGAWTRWGFHEDGLMSGISVAKSLGAKIPWNTNVPAADDVATAYPGVDA